MKDRQSANRDEAHLPWAGEMSRVYAALMRDRWNLRRAARFSGDPALKRLFRRLAYRRRRNIEEFPSSASPDSASDDQVDGDVGGFTRDLERATEVGTIAACLRSNRRLRIAIERTLAAQPPDRVGKQLRTLRTSATREAGTLEARLRDIAVRGFANSADRVD